MLVRRIIQGDDQIPFLIRNPFMVAPALAPSLASQRISEILSSIGIDGKQTFLAKWIGNVREDDHICYDISNSR